MGESGRASAWARRVVVVAAACLVVGVEASPAGASQLHGAVINDVFQLQTVGTVTATAATLPTPEQYSSFVVFGGQQLDTPEAIPDVIHEMAMLKAGGGQIFRFTLPWPSIETDPTTPGSPPSWNPLAVERLDAILTAAHELGLKVLVNFSNTPCGRSSAPNKNCKVINNGWSTYPPTNEQDLTDAIKAISDRWGADIYAIEVWNEPNLPQFFMSGQPLCDSSDPTAFFGAGPDSTRAAAYVPMLKAAWQGVKSSSHPNILVVAADTSFADTQFLQDLYADGMQGFYNAISVHPYQFQLVYQPAPTACGDRGNRSTLVASAKDPTQTLPAPFGFQSGVSAFHSVMQAHGDNSPLWLTEFGYNSCSGAPVQVREEAGQSNTMAPYRSDWSAVCVGWGNQACWLADSFEMAATWPYVGAVMSYQMRDPIAGENQFSLGNFGLLRRDMSPKLAYADVAEAWAGRPVPAC